MKRPSESGFVSNQVAQRAAWLVRLRWLAAYGQLLTVLVTWLVFAVHTAWGPLLALIAVTGGTNVALATWTRRPRARGPMASENQELAVLAAVLAWDILTLTAMLALTGGARNPFATFYLVNLALAAVLLPQRWSLLLAVITAVAYGLILRWSVPLPIDERLTRWGMWVAFATSSIIVVYFVGRLTDQLRHTERLLRRSEASRHRQEKLEALGTLAGGAAHELATPLSTIALAASELERAGADTRLPESMRLDVQLIRDEVRQCSQILNRLRGGAGQPPVERAAIITAGDLITRVVQPLRDADRLEIHWATGAAHRSLEAPVESLAQALRAVVTNAVDASPPHCRVRLNLETTDDGVLIAVRDEGPGMTSEVAARVGEPFFTTKPPGEGMGLGLFFARSVIERVHGTIEFSEPRSNGPDTDGFVVRVWLPTCPD